MVRFFFPPVQFRGQPVGARPGDRLFAPERDDRIQPDRQSAKGRVDLLHDQAQHQIGYAHMSLMISK
jgi:hypothetical protein